MDPIAVFAAPVLGAACQQLAAIGWATFTNWKNGRKDDQIPVPDASVLRGDLAPLRIPEHIEQAMMEQIHTDLAFMRDNYGQAGPFELDDETLISVASRLRGNLEDLFGQHITFVGEDHRPASGAPRLRVRARITNVKGNSEAAAIAGEPPRGDTEVDFEADGIEDGSGAYAIKREVR
jgi:hypothetical protein